MRITIYCIEYQLSQALDIVLIMKWSIFETNNAALQLSLIWSILIVLTRLDKVYWHEKELALAVYVVLISEWSIVIYMFYIDFITYYISLYLILSPKYRLQFLFGKITKYEFALPPMSGSTHSGCTDASIYTVTKEMSESVPIVIETKNFVSPVFHSSGLSENWITASRL